MRLLGDKRFSISKCQFELTKKFGIPLDIYVDQIIEERGKSFFWRTKVFLHRLFRRSVWL